MRHAPGQLDQEVSLLSRTLAADGTGGATATWTEYASVWAKVQPASGGEKEESMRTEARSRYLVVIYHRDDVKESDIVRWNGRDLNVRFVRRGSARDLFLELECELGARA